MPLPTSGPIGADDINDDIGNQAGSQLDIDQIATIVYNLSRPHGFNEFYGLGATGAENIDVLNTPYLIDAAGGVYQPVGTVRADNRYNIVVTYEADTELQWATGFIYSVIVNGTLGQYPNANWLKTEPENAVPFTGPYNSYRTLTFGSFPNDIGNYSRIGYINFVGSVTGVFVVQQQANLFWATVMGSNSWEFAIQQGSTSTVSPLYELTAGPNSSHGGYNPESFFLTTTFAPTGEDPEDWIEGRSRKLAELGYTTWYSFKADDETIFSFGPDDYIDIRAKQVNNTYHDIVFTIYFNSDLIDKAQEGEWLNRLPVTIRLEGLDFTFNMTPSFTSISRIGGNPTITFVLSSGTWSNLSADKNWVSFGKTSGTANDSTIMYVGTNPFTTTQTITVSATSSVTGEAKTFQVTQDGLPNFDSDDITIGNWSINGQTGLVNNPSVTITNNYAFTISYGSGYNSSTNSYPTVSTSTTRGVTVSVTVPDDGSWGNPNQSITNSSTRSQAAYVVPQTITVDSVSPTSLGTFIGASTAITVTSSTSFTANLFSYGFKFSNSQGLGVTRNSDTSISGTTGTRTVYVETTVDNTSGTSVRDGQVNFYTTTGGGSALASFSQSYPITWNANVSSLSFGQTGGTQTITLNTSLSWTASVSGTGFSINITSGTSGTKYINVTSTSSDDSSFGTVTFSASGQTDITVSLSKAAAPTEYSWFLNGVERFGNVTVTPSTISTSYSVGLYGYRGSTAVATTWMLARVTAGGWIDAATTTSGTTSFAIATSTQNTNGTPNLYLNIETNTGSARSGQAEITVDGIYVGTIYVNQDGVSGGSGGSGGDPGERPNPGDQI